MSLYWVPRAFYSFYFTFFNYTKVKGKENIIKNGPLVIFCNHQRMLDVPLVAMCFKRQIRFMAKKAIFNVPIIGKLAIWCGAYPVDRKKADFTAVKTSLKILKENGVLGIFPEGTRSKNLESSAQAKGGVTMLAYKGKAMLQPVKIQYKRKFIFFNRIDVTIGKAISYEDLGIVEANNDEFKRIGVELMENLYKL